MEASKFESLNKILQNKCIKSNTQATTQDADKHRLLHQSMGA
jgi:hypothetical protein